jgi:hypothetical protein
MPRTRPDLGAGPWAAFGPIGVGLVALLLLIPPTSAAGPTAHQVRPPYAGTAIATVVNSTTCHGGSKILTPPGFNLTSGHASFHAQAFAHSCPGKGNMSFSALTARTGLSTSAFGPTSTANRTLSLDWVFSWSGNLTVVNRSRCTYCSASTSLELVGQLNDTTNGSSVKNFTAWRGAFLWTWSSHIGAHTQLSSQTGVKVVLFFSAHLVRGHKYLFWTFLVAHVEASVLPGSQQSTALGSASATVQLAGSHLALILE